MNEELPRIAVPEMDEILGRPFRALDNGFVRAVDYMGGDAAIVQAARVSYGAGTKQFRGDRGLIRYLLRHQHTTPFEMCEVKLHVRVPMDCWRQWIRHRTASVNEYSTRYSVAIDDAARTLPSEWRTQSKNNRQGSEHRLSNEIGSQLTEQEDELLRKARSIYDHRLSVDVAREQARKDLPLSTYTEAYWKIDLHNLLHFLRLRLDGHAQYEIRAYATLIHDEILRRWCPIVYEAFCDYALSNVTFSGPEAAILRASNVSENAARRTAIDQGILDENGDPSGSGRELEEFAEKLEKIGRPLPWILK